MYYVKILCFDTAPILQKDLRDAFESIGTSWSKFCVALLLRIYSRIPEVTQKFPAKGTGFVAVILRQRINQSHEAMLPLNISPPPRPH